MSVDYTEENILLAGQISNKHPVFKLIAQMDKESAFAYLILSSIDETLQKEPMEQLKDLVLLNGQINFMSNCSELSKLAAIMGDTRRRTSFKGLKDSLVAAKNHE